MSTFKHLKKKNGNKVNLLSKMMKNYLEIKEKFVQN